jgi:hypothetical protein
MGWFLRRPLGLFAAIVVIGVALIALGMKAFGGTSSAPLYSATPLSPAQFSHLGQNACVSLQRQLKAATGRGPGNLTDAARSVRTVASTLDRLNLELDARIPPASEVIPFRRLLGNIRAADRALHSLDRLTGSGQWQRATLLVRSRGWQDIGKQLGPSARLGHTRCRAHRTQAILTAIRVRVARGTSAASYYFAKPLSPAHFVHAVERICVSFRGRLENVTAERPTNVTEAAQVVDNLTTLFDSFVTEIRGLTPPPPVAVSYRRVLGQIQTADRAAHSVDQLEKLGQWQRAARLVRSRWWKNIWSQFGPPVAPADIRCG